MSTGKVLVLKTSLTWISFQIVERTEAYFLITFSKMLESIVYMCSSLVNALFVFHLPFGNFRKEHWTFWQEWLDLRRDISSLIFFDVCLSLGFVLSQILSLLFFLVLVLFCLCDWWEEFEEALGKPTDSENNLPHIVEACWVWWGRWSSYQYLYWWLQWKLVEMFCFPIDLWSIISC